MTTSLSNFGRNLHFQPEAYYEPKTEEEVLQILEKHSGSKIRTIGSLHSWSEAPQGDGIVLCLRHLNEVSFVDRTSEKSHALIGAGAQIKHLLSTIEKQGKTLPSLGLITEQRIAGAISTGTHGSGRECLSHFVDSVRIARYDSQTGKAIIEEIDSGEAIRAARCSLGNMGVILSVQMQCRDLYQVEEHWQHYATLDSVLDAQRDYPLQQFFFIPWKWEFTAQHRQVTSKPVSSLEWLYRIYFFLIFDIGLHIVLIASARILESRWLVHFLFRHVLGNLVICNWRVNGKSSRMLIMEHELFRHIETELFVTADQLPAALEFIKQTLSTASLAASSANETSDCYREQISRLQMDDELEKLRGCYDHHYPICIRRVLADQTLMSASSSGELDWYAISMISYQTPDKRDGFFRTMKFLSSSMARLYGARPHWGKHNPLTAAELTALYPNFAAYIDQCQQRDPSGRFRNRWFDELFRHTQEKVV